MKVRLNGRVWKIFFVSPNDYRLIDRTGEFKFATTNSYTDEICLDRNLKENDKLLKTVLLHELGHASIFSYDLLSEIHHFVPEDRWIEAEEWICNFLADYSRELIQIEDVLGELK